MKTSIWTTPIPFPAAFSDWLSWPILSRKEFRAIEPGLGCGILFGMLSLITRNNWTGGLVFLLYPLTCSAIGALAFGHDYTHRTLSSFLALPIPRSRIWWLRLRLCLFAMLVVAVLLIASTYSQTLWMAKRGAFDDPWRRAFAYIARLAIVPILSGLFLAPWLTLISRSALFGTIVSLVIPFMLELVWGSIARALGFDHPEVFWPQLGLLPMTALSTVFAVLGWRKFQRLEALDGPVEARSRTRARAGRATQNARRSSVAIQLVKKDLMLLRMPLALAVAGMLLTLFLNKDQAALWTLVYPAMTVLLIGAVSTADERQLGVSEWQVLMPIAFWKQWTIKFLVTWLTALIVGLALPIGVLYLKTGDWQHIEGRDFAQVIPVFIAASFEFVAFTVYVSSLCNSGLKALIAAILVNISAAYMMIRFFEAYSKLLSADGIEATVWWTDWRFWPVLMAFFGMAALALLLAMRNHRYTERGAPRLIRQLSAFAAYEVGAVIAVTMFWNWYSWLR